MPKKTNYETIQRIRELKQKGRTNEEIAATLGVGIATAKIHSRGIVGNLQCPYCGKKFRSSQGLGVHLKLVHPITKKQEEDFCSVCEYWALFSVTMMGIKLYGCRLKTKPIILGGELFCQWRNTSRDI